MMDNKKTNIEVEGLTLSDPFWPGKLISKDKNGDEYRLKRYLLVWGKINNKRAIMKIIKVPVLNITTFKSSHEHFLKQKAEEEDDDISYKEGYRYRCVYCNKKFKREKECRIHAKKCKNRK